ncbi:hypothetical protein IG631_21656 [Alternaria alternata]|nr:hypothetical protein IG631_21656 [Alternaria alternata]
MMKLVDDANKEPDSLVSRATSPLASAHKQARQASFHRALDTQLVTSNHPTWLVRRPSLPVLAARLLTRYSGPILAFSSLILVAGGLLFQFLNILTGGVNKSPLNKFYFLEASTEGIPNARNPSRWTFFAICGSDPSSGNNANCGSPVPALPFDPPRNFGTQQNIPEQFIGTHQYYYLSRFMFAFYLIALFFAAIALISGLLALCSRLGGYLSSLMTFVALFFQTLAAALMT